MEALAVLCSILKQARLDQGLTQKELAKRAGVSRAWLIALESGTASRAELGKVLDLATTLGLELKPSKRKPLDADAELIMQRYFDA
ncbi:MAG: helix-turn-helix domain-containing protein [Coriobacteriales bacterium]|jgi:transcriptional regulator with XRE-family HTH domain|nr:helix-turn-helix domain-containing protein [Coriobacteriales bacterium]